MQIKQGIVDERLQYGNPYSQTAVGPDHPDVFPGLYRERKDHEARKSEPGSCEVNRCGILQSYLNKWISG